MRCTFLIWLISYVWISFCPQASGQDRSVTIDVGKSRLTMQEELVYQITLENEASRAKSGLIDFPNLPGFKKDLQKRSFPVVFEDGKRKKIDVIQQKYLPEKPGIFQFPQFQLLIDDQNYILAPRRVTVIDSIPALATFVPKVLGGKEAFLATSLSSKEVYVGQEVIIEVALYIPKQTPFDWDFPKDVSAQIEQMAQRIKPLDCLENRVIISSITSEEVKLNDQNFTKYRLFLSRYIPLKSGRLTFPSVEFKPSRKSKGESTFASVSLKTSSEGLQVISLPDHPLKDKVAVGSFYWSERLTPKRLEIGKPGVYEVRLQGSSSLLFTTWPAPASDVFFDFYPDPNPTKPISGAVRTFRFQIIPKKAGKVDLNRYFQFYYFNPAQQKYDTLKSRIQVAIGGDSFSVAVKSDKKESIFDRLAERQVTDSYVNLRSWGQSLANLCIFVVFISSIFLFYNRFNQKS